VKLTATFWKNPRLAPLVDGEVGVEGLEIEWHLDHPSRLFQRQKRENNADLFEMDIATLLGLGQAPELSHLRWTALPVFLTRAWVALTFVVNPDAGIARLEDLAGKRFGLPNLSMPAGVWLRIMLQTLFGLPNSEITWVTPQRGSANAPSLGEMMQQGLVDAAFLPEADASSGARQLLDGPAILSIARRFHEQTGVVPVNHAAAMQSRLLADDPALRERLVSAFEQSKYVSFGHAPSSENDAATFPSTEFERQVTGMDGDAFPSGLEANRRSLELLARQLVEDGLLTARPDLDAIFGQK